MTSGESLATIGCCDKTMFLSYLMQTHPLFVSIVMFVKIRDFATSSCRSGFDGADKRWVGMSWISHPPKIWFNMSKMARWLWFVWHGLSSRGGLHKLLKCLQCEPVQVQMQIDPRMLWNYMGQILGTGMRCCYSREEPGTGTGMAIQNWVNFFVIPLFNALTIPYIINWYKLILCRESW